jgi:hypothetical protein
MRLSLRSVHMSCLAGQRDDDLEIENAAIRYDFNTYKATHP